MTATRTILLAILLLCFTLFVFLILHIIINFVQKRWAHVQSRRAYPEFVAEFDLLTPEDIVWEPYSELAIATFTLRLTARTESGDSSVKGSCILCRQHWIGSNAMTTGNNSYTTSVTMHCIVN